ncbi:MAG: phosphatase PAP2 family protein [Fidelibacterota bacterium]
MKFFNKKYIWFILLSGIITGQTLPGDWVNYWEDSGQSIITDHTNQWILGIGALAAIGATRVDLKVKDYAQTRGLLSDPVSHFGDLYGGTWAHWILFSSILVTSATGNDNLDDFMAKMEFSTFAMMTNGTLTYGMKRAFGRKRPNGSCCTSFPSGHTSHSFVIAAIIQELYGNKIGKFAYGMATLVAISRINDNKHYLSDVIFGSALGTAVGRAFGNNYHQYTFKGLGVGITPYSLRITIPL